MDHYQHPGSKNRVLSGDQILQVNEYALKSMEKVGCRIESKEALDLLGDAGCDIGDPNRVRIPRHLVLEAIEAAPEEIDIFNRDGQLSMTLKEDACYYGTGSDCPTTIDLDSGIRRACTKNDIARLTQFCDALPNIDFVMSFGIANDAPNGCNFLHQYEAMLLNTQKPIIVTAYGTNDMTAIIKMAATARGGVDEMKKSPPLILYSEPLSPLVHTDIGVGKCLMCCDYEIPFIYIGAAMMGASGPSTLEGTLVQTVAESLAGLVIFQRKRPGAKFIFGGDASIMDMSTGIFCYGSPELNIINAALADMAHFYKLPFFCLAGSSDSQVLDAQAGFEYAMSLYIATLNGCNLIHDCGYLESGLTSSFESVLFTDEIIGYIKRMLRPIKIDEETVPLRIMEDVGPGGSFLQENHTVNNFKNTFWFPRFLNRKVFDEWEKDGARDIRKILNEKSKEIYDNHKPKRLPSDVTNSINEIAAKHQPDI